MIRLLLCASKTLRWIEASLLAPLYCRQTERPHSRPRTWLPKHRVRGCTEERGLASRQLRADEALVPAHHVSGAPIKTDGKQQVVALSVRVSDDDCVLRAPNSNSYAHLLARRPSEITKMHGVRLLHQFVPVGKQIVMLLWRSSEELAYAHGNGN